MKYWKNALFVLLLLMFFVCDFGSSEAYATSYFDITTSVGSDYHVTIKWKKQSVTSYRVYRASASASGCKVGSYTRLATISGSRTSYVDKKVQKNKRYIYLIRGYKSGKLKCESVDNEGYVYTGVGKALWSDYSYASYFSTFYIKLIDGYTEHGMTCDGIQIYRRVTGTKTFKKLAVIHKSSLNSYSDKTVSKGKSYDYRFRGYKKINNKIVYGSFSSVVTKKAVIWGGIYAIQVDAPSAADSEMVEVTIESHKDNGKLGFSGGIGDYDCASASEDSDEYTDDPWLKDMELEKYSYDGKTWSTYSDQKTIYLKAGQRIHLLYSVETAGDISEFSDKVESFSDWVTYENVPFIITWTPNSYFANVEVNGDLIA